MGNVGTVSEKRRGKDVRIILSLFLAIGLLCGCSLQIGEDESWKNGCEPALANVSLNGVWPIEGQSESMTISNFSWREFDAYVPSIGHMHFELTDPAVKGQLRYEESSVRYALIWLVEGNVRISVLNYVWTSASHVSITGYGCSIDYAWLLENSI